MIVPSLWPVHKSTLCLCAKHQFQNCVCVCKSSIPHCVCVNHQLHIFCVCKSSIPHCVCVQILNCTLCVCVCVNHQLHIFCVCKSSIPHCVCAQILNCTLLMCACHDIKGEKGGLLGGHRDQNGTSCGLCSLNASLLLFF